MNKLHTFILFSLIFTTVSAQESLFNMDAQLRSRGEYNNGYLSQRGEGVSPGVFVNERARLGIGYERYNLELKASVQHAGIWGQDALKERSGRVAMNECWAKLNFGEGFFAQVGRQQLSYDDERILGASDWDVAGNWHDALRLGYEASTHKAHAVFALNQNKETRDFYYSGTMPYKMMQTLWYHFQPRHLPFSISAHLVTTGYEAGSEGQGKTKFMHTVGTDINYHPGNLTLHTSGYYQFGKIADGRNVDAYLLNLNALLAVTRNVSLTLGYDYSSGNHKGTGQNAFDPLFGTHHKFFGAMDYFTGRLSYGLQDLQAGTQVHITKKINAKADFHYFRTAPKLGYETRHLGQEVDCQFSARLQKDIELTAGYSFMLGTSDIEYFKGGNHSSWQDWGWVTINIYPRLFQTRW